MVFKYIFSISGDKFYPEKILNKTQGFIVDDSYFSPTDKKKYNQSDEYGFGTMSFWHPKKYSTEDQIVEYEKAFIQFIEQNNDLFVKNGVEELEIFMEIYFDGGQCNFEIFDKTELKILTSFGVSLPISVYILPVRKIKQWEKEIKVEWEKD